MGLFNSSRPIKLTGQYFGTHPEIKGHVKKMKLVMNENGVDVYADKDTLNGFDWDEITGFDSDIVDHSTSSQRISVTRMATLGVFSLAAPKKTGSMDRKFIYTLHTTTGDVQLETDIKGKAGSGAVKAVVAALEKNGTNARAYAADHATGEAKDPIAELAREDNETEMLEKLALLRKRDLITDAEYAAKKRKILGI